MQFDSDKYIKENLKITVQKLIKILLPNNLVNEKKKIPHSLQGPLSLISWFSSLLDIYLSLISLSPPLCYQLVSPSLSLSLSLCLRKMISPVGIFFLILSADWVKGNKAGKLILAKSLSLRPQVKNKIFFFLFGLNEMCVRVCGCGCGCVKVGDSAFQIS